MDVIAVKDTGGVMVASDLPASSTPASASLAETMTVSPSMAELARPSPAANALAASEQDMEIGLAQDIGVGCLTAVESTIHQHMNVECAEAPKLRHAGIDLEEEDTGIPKLGMKFDSITDAEDFYHRYSAKVGFSVRIRRTKFDHGVVTRRTYCCYKEGFRDPDRSKSVAYHRPNFRCGCNAHYSIKLLHDGVYQVFQFDPNHNHEVVAPEKVHLLRSHRRMIAAQKGDVDVTSTSGSGMTPKMSMEFFSRQAGRHKNIGFTERDSKKYPPIKRMLALKKGEASAILEYFQRMQSNNPSSFYALQLDENELLTNMFWADPTMITDYHHFCDVVCLDTTYKTNNKECPLALFVGINHHSQIIVFGAALLFDETSMTFEWLFNTFIQAMGGKKPKTILTDQCAAIGSAISLALPETYHRLCVWQMYKNAMVHLHEVFKKNPNILGDFEKCIFEHNDGEQFELAWYDMIKKYNLQENEWLKERFEARDQWALAYGRDNFYADMSTMQRSETLNSAVKKCLHRGCSILQFFEHFERVLDARRYEELKADFNMKQTTQYMCVQWKLLKHAESVYTPAVFKMFEKEVIVIFDLELLVISVNGTVTNYKVSETNPNRVCFVSYNDADCSISCTCKTFEFVGILCRHALKVFERMNIMNIPEQYILKRWTKKAKEGVAGDSHGLMVDLDHKGQISARYRDLSPILVQLATKASLCDEATKMVGRFALKMLKDIDGHMECALGCRFRLDTSIVGNCLKSGEAENERVVDGSSMRDENPLGGEEADHSLTVHVGSRNGSKGVEKEKAVGSLCRFKNGFEKVVKGKRNSPKVSKPKKPRSTPLVENQTSIVPQSGIHGTPQLQPQVAIPSSSVSWPFIANYPIF